MVAVSDVPRPDAPQKPSDTDATGPTDTRGISGNGGGGDTPPRSRARKATTRRAPSGGLEDKLGEFFGSFSLVFAMAGDQYCAEIVAQRSPALASAWADLAKQNAHVKRVLEGLVEGSAWGGVVFSTLGIAIPIAKHHGIYTGPDPFSMILPGPTPPPDHAPRGNGGTGRDGRGFQWDKSPDGPAPAPPAANGSSSDDTPDPDVPVYMPGAPPGVVTVAASNAAHQGAR